MIMEYYGSLWMFNVYGCWLMFMDAIACCLMPFLGHLPLQEASETPTLELEKPELVELMEDVVVNSRATDLIRFILNHESLTEEFCYMNRSGPYEWLGGSTGSLHECCSMLQQAAAVSSSLWLAARFMWQPPGIDRYCKCSSSIFIYYTLLMGPAW